VTAKTYLLETRPRFLVLSLALAVLGSGMAAHSGAFHLGHAAVLLVGLVLLHVSVNTLNDYFDYRSGIDLAARRTPFSGGSGMIPAGLVTEKGVLALGLGAFLLAVPIGVYFLAERGLALLPLFAAGAVLVLAYTPLLTRIGGGTAEAAAGLGLGTLPVIGIYYIITGEMTAPAVYASVPSGFLVANLLLLNEFPDKEADRVGHRKTLPIVLGSRGAAWVYAVLAVGTYAWIVAGVAFGLMPPLTLLGCLTLPMAAKAIAGAFGSQDVKKLTPALGANATMVLLTLFLMGAGFIAAALA